MLEVLFDAVALSGPPGQGGIGTYQRRLLEGLAAKPDELRVHVLARDDVALPTNVLRRRLRRRAPGRLAQLEHDLRLPIDIRRAPRAVFHSPAPFAPRILPGRPWVQTLFDVIPLVFDDPALASARRRFEASARGYRSADAVIAISRHAADEGIRFLGIDPGRIHVVPLSVAPSFVPAPDGVRPTPSRPYVLLVSQYDARKGFAEAFEVAGALADAGFPHTLKVAGNLPDWVRPTVERLRAEASHPDRIELLGFVDDLVPLFWDASATIVTSRYEGFGLPALEAMATGSPLVAFANSSLPEVIGDGGVLVPDGDIGAFVEALGSLLADDDQRAALSAAGLARAARFTREAFVDGHVDVYKSLAP